MRSSDDKPTSAPQERRDDRRDGICEPARLLPLSDSVEVMVENVSEGGLFVVLEGGLEFEIQLMGETKTRRVQLVRSQTLPGQKAGLGFKFKNAGMAEGEH